MTLSNSNIKLKKSSTYQSFKLILNMKFQPSSENILLKWVFFPKHNLQRLEYLVEREPPSNQRFSQKRILSSLPTMYLKLKKNTSKSSQINFHEVQRSQCEPQPRSQPFSFKPYQLFITLYHRESSSKGNLKSHYLNKALFLLMMLPIASPFPYSSPLFSSTAELSPNWPSDSSSLHQHFSTKSPS